MYFSLASPGNIYKILIATQKIISLSFFIMCYVVQNAIKIDEDLIANSARSLETLVSVGMKLGVSQKASSHGLPNLGRCVLQD